MAQNPNPNSPRFAPIAAAPALLTLGNLTCGFLAVFYASRADAGGGVGPYTPMDIAAGLIFVGMLFDAFDGAVARATHTVSKFGAQLDSMADMVTFGVAPAFLIIQLNRIETPFFAEVPLDTYIDRAVLCIAAAYVACAGLRLARYNANDADRETNAFFGLPSPGAAGCIASLTLLSISIHEYISPRAASYLVMTTATVCLVLAVAMVSPLPYPHVFKRYLLGREPLHYIGLAVIALTLLLTVPQWAASAGFLLYCASGPLNWFRQRHPQPPTPEPTTTPQQELHHRLN